MSYLILLLLLLLLLLILTLLYITIIILINYQIYDFNLYCYIYLSTYHIIHHTYTYITNSYLYGQYKRLNDHYGQLGKGLLWGGAPTHFSAQGYGAVQFAKYMLKDKGFFLLFYVTYTKHHILCLNVKHFYLTDISLEGKRWYIENIHIIIIIHIIHIIYHISYR